MLCQAPVDLHPGPAGPECRLLNRGQPPMAKEPVLVLKLLIAKGRDRQAPSMERPFRETPCTPRSDEWLVLGQCCRWPDGRSQTAMCQSPAVQPSGDGERRLLHPSNWNYRPVAVIGACRKLSLNVELRGLARLFARDPYRPQGLLYGCFCSTRRAPLSKRLMVTFLLGKLGASSPATSKASMAIRASLLF